MNLRAALIAWGVCFLVLLPGCTRRGADSPDDPGPCVQIHAPWPDEEAELMALQLSGQVCAPRDLYEQIRDDLASIRAQWGDSIPPLGLSFRPPWMAGRLLLSTDSVTQRDILSGSYTEWDTLNAQFGMEGAVFDDPAAGSYLVFSPRLHPSRLVEAYAGLPGFRWVRRWMLLADGPNVYAHQHANGLTYLFEFAWMDCEDSCRFRQYWYFRSTKSIISHVGTWRPPPLGDEPEPRWWPEASENRDSYAQDDPPVLPADTTAPGAITDLSATAVTCDSFVLRWTAPGDDGVAGTATRYDVRTSAQPIGAADWESLMTVFSLLPQAPGTVEVSGIGGLPSNWYRYVAIKTADEVPNWSAISNTARGQALGEWTTYTTENSGLISNRISAITVDLHGGVWIATEDRGISRFDIDGWTTYTTSNSMLAEDQVTAITTAGNGEIWCGTEGGGVCRFDGSDWVDITLPEGALVDVPITAIAVDVDGMVWCGSAGGGAGRFDGSAWTIFTSSDSGLADNTVTSIAIGKDRRVWFATPAGACFFDGVDWATHTRSNSGLPTNNVQSVAIDQSGYVWLGLWDKYTGICCFNGVQWISYSTANSGLASNFVYIAYAAPHGSLWFGTKRGVSNFGTEWTTFDTETSDLVSNTVRAIAVDSAGNVWFGTPEGISRYCVSGRLAWP